MVAVRTLPPINITLDNIGQVIPDFNRIQNNIVPGNDRDQLPIPSKMQLINIFDIPVLTLLKNLANTFILVINDILKTSSYASITDFLAVFTSGDRLMYIGIILVCFALFFSFFFY